MLTQAKTDSILTDFGQKLVADASMFSELKERYQEVGFVQIEDVIRADTIRSILRDVYDGLFDFAEELSGPHIVSAESLGPGGHYSRLDYGFPKSSAEQRTRVFTLLNNIGFVAFGSSLAATLTPLIEFIVQRPVKYDRIFFLFYKEGDYISPHNDAQTGERLNIQFPVAFSSASVLRVLEHGLFRLHYDTAGCMRVLGPRVWHEVPPVLRYVQDTDPFRVNLTLRFI